MKHYFQHPKRTNGTLNTSNGVVTFEQDEFGRPGIFVIPHTEETIPVIEALQKLNLKDIGEPTAVQLSAEKEKSKPSETGSMTFKLPKGHAPIAHTSAGDIQFVNGLATVSGKKADILIALKYEVVSSITEQPKKEIEIGKKMIVPTLEEYIASGRDGENYEREFLGFKAGDEFTFAAVAENQKKKPGLTTKQLIKLAKDNNIETKDKTDEELTAVLKSKGILQ